MKQARFFISGAMAALGVALACTTAKASSDRQYHSRPLTLALTDEVPADANTKATDLAQQLQNPIADLISVPIQNSFDFGFGPEDAMRFTSTIQPIYPFKLSKDWNLVTRTIVPIIYQESPFPGGSDLSGLGDITESLFFSPSKMFNGWVFGGGPIFQLPTATDNELGSEKWGAGPTAVALRQSGPWSYGLLLNHVWSFAGDSSRSEVSNTLINPWLAYTTKDQWTFPVQSESFYDWAGDQWTVPIEVQVAKLVMFGKQPVQFTLAGRSFVERAPGGPDWGMGINVTFLFPK
jgi:hypothetical protein